MDDASTSHLDPAAARALLGDADGMSARATRAARWWVGYMTAFALGFGALTLFVGSADGPGELVAPMVAFGVLVVVMVVFARTRPVQGGVSRRVFLGGWIGTSLLYSAAVWVGLLTGWPLSAWVLAALLVAAPLGLAAWRTHRTLR